MIFDGAAKKYGFKLKPLTAPSQSAKNTTPNTNGVAIFLTRSRVFIFEFLLSDLLRHELQYSRHGLHVYREELHVQK